MADKRARERPDFFACFIPKQSTLIKVWLAGKLQKSKPQCMSCSCSSCSQQTASVEAVHLSLFHSSLSQSPALPSTGMAEDLPSLPGMLPRWARESWLVGLQQHKTVWI
jgi:hypothetical protein